MAAFPAPDGPRLALHGCRQLTDGPESPHPSTHRHLNRSTSARNHGEMIAVRMGNRIVTVSVHPGRSTGTWGIISAPHQDGARHLGLRPPPTGPSGHRW